MYMKKGIVKQLFAMLIACIIILCPMADNAVHAASIAMPILPYVPPNSAQIMDLISNAFGVTAPAIEDAAEKFQAYLKLYQTILGASYDSFKTELEGIIDDAKTSGVITINQNASTIIQSALNEALQNGYEVDTGIQGINNVDDAFQWIVTRFPNTVTYSYFTVGDLMNDLVVNGGNANQNCNIYIVIETNYINVFMAPLTTSLYVNGKTVNGNVSRIRVRTVSTTTRDYNNGNNINIPFTFNNLQEFVNLGNIGIERKNVSAQSQSIVTSLSTGEVVPVTADTDINNMAGDVKIKIPSVTIYPAENVEDLPGVQDDLGVIPTTADTTQAQLEDIIEQLQELQATKYGDVSKYSINLTEYFPFCIPFDIGNILTMFVAEPEAPVVTFPLPVGYGEDGIIMQEFTLDLSQFDTVALWCRRGMLLVFIVGLAMVTRKVFLRG